MKGQAVARKNLGAWVLKCNPEVWDVVAFMADGGTSILEWSVGATYRKALMMPGDIVVLWVSGTRANDIEPGIWGVGRVLSHVHPQMETERGYWRDLDAMRRAQWAIDLDIPLWDVPIAREVLKADEVLRGIETLQMPQGSNPSYLTRAEWTALEPLLEEEIPEPPPKGISDVDDLIETPDVHTRVMIEEAAVAVVRSWLERDNWKVDDRQKDNVGWDLTATRGSETALVEVKGRFGNAVDVLLTPNEIRAAGEHDNWELAVVTGSLEKTPRLHWFAADEVRSESKVALHRFTSAGAD